MSNQNIKDMYSSFWGHHAPIFWQGNWLLLYTYLGIML